MSRAQGLDDDLVESEVELDNSDVVELDDDPPAEMGDPSVAVNEKHQEGAQVFKSKAMDAILEGDLNQGIGHLTDAILLNPMPVLYASRAIVFVKLKKPNAAIRDADAALKIDPSLAKGYKARGMARALLGLWEDAATDLQMASKLDFDVEASRILRRVASNVKKIQEHKQKYKRLRIERELKKIELERLRVSQEEAEHAHILKDGEVIVIGSASELRTKLREASRLSRLAVLYFTAVWSGPCRYLGPVVKSFAEKYPKVVFLKIDVEELPDVGAACKVPSIPCFYFSKEGKIIEKILEINPEAIQNTICKHSG